jgi:hypothetical protein
MSSPNVTPPKSTPKPPTSEAARQRAREWLHRLLIRGERRPGPRAEEVRR